MTRYRANDPARFVPLTGKNEEALMSMIQAQLVLRPDWAEYGLRVFQNDESPADFVGYLTLLQGLVYSGLMQVFGDRKILDNEQSLVALETLDCMSEWFSVPEGSAEGIKDLCRWYNGESDGLRLLREQGLQISSLIVAATLATLLDLDTNPDSDGNGPIFTIVEDSNWYDSDDWEERLTFLLYMAGYSIPDEESVTP